MKMRILIGVGIAVLVIIIVGTQSSLVIPRPSAPWNAQTVVMKR